MYAKDDRIIASRRALSTNSPAKESSAVRSLLSKHPYLAVSVLLATGMEGVFYFFASRNVALAPAQYAAVAVATAMLAGLCVWIITWE